jgi:type II secretory pathway predicted ATPase ExeA
MNRTAQSIITPFLYQDFRRAADLLLAALRRHDPYVLLLGDSGSGKTTLLRYLQTKLDKRSFSVLYLCHGRPSPSALARVLADALHLPIRRTRAETSRLLLSTLKNLPAKLLLWIDEAQLIHDDTLHELRLLSEADLDGPPLFCVVLCALPQLKERLLAPDLFPLYRRISARVRLRGLVHEEVTPFLNHAISKNAAARFSAEALSVIFEQARAIPAIIKSHAAFCIEHCPNTKNPIDKQTVVDLLESIETI